MWYFFALSDDEFDNLLKNVESEYANRKFDEFGVIKHITGLFLKLSEIGLYSKSKEEILNESKLYIEHLRKNNPRTLIDFSKTKYIFNSYAGLGFHGIDIIEFQKFRSHIDEVRKLAIVENMPSAGQELLNTMQSNVREFCNMIYLSNSQERNASGCYYQFPIFRSIKEEDFINTFLAMNNEQREMVFYALSQRYKYDSSNEELLEEVDWLKSVQRLLLEEASRNKGKVSGYNLESLNKTYLSEIIEKLEKRS